MGANFCASCGRKVAGWRTGVRAALGGATAGGVPLPGGDEPTRAVQPSESLLRAVALSKEPPIAVSTARPVAVSSAPPVAYAEPPPVGASTSLPPVSGARSPILVGGFVLGLGALLVGAVYFATREHAVAPVAPSNAPTVANEPVAPPVAAPPPAATTKRSHAHRISAPLIATAPSTKPAATKPATTAKLLPPPKTAAPVATNGTKAGALPHKASTVDSRTATPSGPSAAPTSEMPVAPTETTENEAAPMTEADRRAEAANRADADGVRFVVHAKLPQVHACYTRAFKETSPGGRVDIGFVIGQNGRATKIRTEQNSTESAGLAKCLEQRIGEWEFPKPSSGDFELIYPFVFSPGT